MLTCFDQPYAAICWNEELKIVELIWKGFASSQDYRKAMDQSLAVIQEKKAVRFLVDSAKLKVILPEDQAWILEVWTPNFARTGAKKLASITPESAVARMSTDRMIRTSAPTPAAVPSPFEYMSFATIAEARVWLKN